MRREQTTNVMLYPPSGPLEPGAGGDPLEMLGLLSVHPKLSRQPTLTLNLFPLICYSHNYDSRNAQRL